MSAKRYFLHVKIVLFILLSFSLAACSGSTPNVTTTSIPTNTFPKGLPLYCPTYIALDQQSNMYVSDGLQEQGHTRIVKLSASGQFLAEWHFFPAGFTGPSQGPTGIAVDNAGNIYIADAGKSRILKVSPGGQLLTTWGKSGNDPGDFNNPQGVALDSHNNVYVADSTNNRIEKFSSTGTFLATWGTQGPGTGQFNNPTNIAIDRHDTLYVLDSQNSRIVKLSAQGKWLNAWQLDSSVYLGIATDMQGNVYAGHIRNGPLKFSPDGKPLSTPISVKGGPISALAVNGQGNVYLINNNTPGGKAQIEEYTPTGQMLFARAGVC